MSEVTILINGHIELREMSRLELSDIDMIITRNMPWLKQRGRISAYVRKPNGILQIVAASRRDLCGN